MHSNSSLISRTSLFIFIASLLIPCLVNGQDSLASITTDSTCVQKELGDLIRAARNKPPKPDDAANAGSLLLLPIIGSNPATGFMLGVGGQYAFKLSGDEARYSLLSGSAQLTTKSQILFLLKNNVYTKNNRIFFTGDWRYLIFSQSTYGLGTNAPEGGILDYQYSLGGAETSSDSLTQPMKFNFLRVYQSASYNIGKGFYAGVGYNLDYYFKIDDERLRLGPTDSLITSHYGYNRRYGFDTKEYYSSALNVNLIWDTRDNMINPFKGYYAMISWRGS